jgi:hypothetical protein
MFDASIIAFFAIWFLFSILAQSDKPIVLKYDHLGLLPTCRFFAPRPVSKDFSVYAKATGSMNYSTAWKPLFYSKKNWWCFIWNPQHRLRKTIGDLLRQLETTKEMDEFKHLSLPYLTLLNSATSIFAKDKHAESVQFMLTSFAGYEDSTNELVFLSNVHRI